jgi:F-type H+-transporting ATPase subunit a
VAAESKIDPMHQFQISGLTGSLDGTPFVFTNSALWMLFVLGAIVVFMWGGMKRELIPGRWQAAVEGFVEFASGLALTSIGPEGRKYVPWIFTIFTFILFCNYAGMLPFAVIPGGHPFTVTSQFTVTGLMAVMSFAIVLIVGFWKHGLHFFSLFVPHGTPKGMLPLIVPIEFISFMIRPFSLALRLFVAMIAGHILVDVFGNFIVSGINSGTAIGYFISAISFIFVLGVNALELLVCGIQAYVFALLASLYINDAVHLH